MKKILFTVFLLSGLYLMANAQQKREFKHQPPVKHRMGMMKAMQLTADQKVKAKTYKESFKAKMQELNKNEGQSVKEFRDKKLALRKELRGNMQDILTPEQKTKMEQMKVDHKAKREEHFAKHMDKMKSKLNLSEDQLTQLKTGHKSMQDKLRALKEDQTLSRTDRHDKLQALKKEMKENRNKIFTADQLKKMEELKKESKDKKWKMEKKDNTPAK